MTADEFSCTVTFRVEELRVSAPLHQKELLVRMLPKGGVSNVQLVGVFGTDPGLTAGLGTPPDELENIVVEREVWAVDPPSRTNPLCTSLCLCSEIQN